MLDNRRLFRRTILFVIAFLSIETFENYLSISFYFPRSAFFSLVIDLPVLKLLILPGIFLISVLLLSYFFVFYYCIYLCAYFLEKSSWPRLKNPRFRKGFVCFNYFLFFNLVYGLNSFLFLNSAVTHRFLYYFLFPYRPYAWFLIALGIYFSIFIVITARLAERRDVVRVLSLPLVLVALTVSEAWITRIPLKPFTRKDNILILGVDSIQYNRLTKEWGYAKDLAPHIAALFDRSTCFVNAWSAFARTYPAYLAILTGRYPVHNGVRDNIVRDKYLNPTNLYLGDILKKHGYYSSHYTDEVRFSIIRKSHGFDELFHPAFGVVNYVFGTFFDYALTNLLLYTNTGSYLLYPLAYNRAHVAYNPDVFVNRAIREMNKLPRDKRQFIVIHLCANHFPYFSPYPYNSDPALADFIEQCIATADHQAERFLEFFEKSGLRKNSILILLSDHGDGWDPLKKSVSHGSDFAYLWANKMVLGIVRQGVEPRKIIDLVRSIDVYPTLLDMVGIPVPRDIDGKSMVRLMQGDREEEPRTFFAETGYNISTKYSKGALVETLEADARKFAVDPQSGIVYLRDQDYEDFVLKRKWYVMIKGTRLLVYNLYYKEEECSDFNPLQPERLIPVADAGSCKDMREQLRQFNNLH